MSTGTYAALVGLAALAVLIVLYCLICTKLQSK